MTTLFVAPGPSPGSACAGSAGWRSGSPTGAMVGKAPAGFATGTASATPSSIIWMPEKPLNSLTMHLS